MESPAAASTQHVVVARSTLPALGRILLCGVALAIATAAWLPPPAGAQAACRFVQGFAALREQVGVATAGACTEDERHAPNGNAEQRTTTGLFVWRKADNWTAFTDGFRTWIAGPTGLVQRLNTQRFAWEADSGAPGTTPVVPPPPLVRREPAAPVLAWYYPQFNQGWATDATNAERAGIDALVISQTTHRGPLGNASIVRAARGTPLLFTLGVEPQLYSSQAALVTELRRILAEDARDMQFLHYRGRPVLVFWALPRVPLEPGQTPQAAWRAIRDQVDPERISVWIAEGGDANPTTGTVSYLAPFDALHLYSVSWDADPGRALAGWARRLRATDPAKLWVATVMPGGDWDDFSAAPAVRHHRDREDGGYLTRSWQGAMATSPSMVIITSFNETFERTQIQPSPQWGTLYLDLNRRLGDAWRASVGSALYGE